MTTQENNAGYPVMYPALTYRQAVKAGFANKQWFIQAREVYEAAYDSLDDTNDRVRLQTERYRQDADFKALLDGYKNQYALKLIEAGLDLNSDQRKLMLELFSKVATVADAVALNNALEFYWHCCSWLCNDLLSLGDTVAKYQTALLHSAMDELAKDVNGNVKFKVNYDYEQSEDLEAYISAELVDKHPDALWGQPNYYATVYLTDNSLTGRISYGTETAVEVDYEPYSGWSIA